MEGCGADFIPPIFETIHGVLFMVRCIFLYEVIENERAHPWVSVESLRLSMQL